MQNSQEWVRHFRNNQDQDRINWEQAPQIREHEKTALLYSLKAWQKGETSDGRHLRAAAARYATHINDPQYLTAIDLFIKEEQKHGANLGRYIDLLGEKRLSFDWGDQLFRWVRYFNQNLEIWTVTVIIVESAAQVFYQALKDGTPCLLLREICTDILMDEAHHIRFQQQRLIVLMQSSPSWSFLLRLALYRILHRWITKAIWLGHARAFIQGGVERKHFKALMEFKLNKIFHAVQEAHLEIQKAKNRQSMRTFLTGSK